MFWRKDPFLLFLTKNETVSNRVTGKQLRIGGPNNCSFRESRRFAPLLCRVLSSTPLWIGWCTFSTFVLVCDSGRLTAIVTDGRHQDRLKIDCDGCLMVIWFYQLVIIIFGERIVFWWLAAITIRLYAYVIYICDSQFMFPRKFSGGLRKFLEVKNA